VFFRDTCVWAGVDSAWEQRKLEARKMLAVGAAYRASEPQANIAQPKRMSAGHPTRQVARPVSEAKRGASNQDGEPLG
jgi:hypothetical protein